jgi:hypothetical protein
MHSPQQALKTFSGWTGRAGSRGPKKARRLDGGFIAWELFAQGYIAVREYFSIAGGKTSDELRTQRFWCNGSIRADARKLRYTTLQSSTPAGNGAAFVFVSLPEQEIIAIV